MCLLSLTNMGRIIAFVVCFLVCFCYSEGEGIYGNAGGTYKDGNNALVKYDAKTGNVTTISKSIYEYLLSDESIIDQYNNIYFYYTETYNNENKSHSAYMGRYNLSPPEEHQYLVSLPFCKAYTFVGLGTTYSYDSNNKAIYIWCRDPKETNQQKLLKLMYNIGTDSFDSTLIKVNICYIKSIVFMINSFVCLVAIYIDICSR